MNKQQLALITGGSSGIGLALAKALAQRGSNVCILGRDQEKLEKAQHDIQKTCLHKHQCIETISCDVTQYETLAQVLDKWTAVAGIPDLVINSAGVTYPGYFQDLDLEIFHWLMDVNYFGTLNVIKCIIPGMIQHGSGTIVNISSQAGFIGVFGYTGYSASKYAVRGLSDALRAEMKPLGINIHVVFPPDTQTPQLEFEKPLKPIETKAIASNAKVLSPERVAESILKGLNKGHYVIIPGVEGQVFYRLVNILGNLIYPIMDWLVRKAQKKK